MGAGSAEKAEGVNRGTALACGRRMALIKADITDGHRWIAMELLLGRIVADLCDECARREAIAVRVAACDQPQRYSRC